VGPEALAGGPIGKLRDGDGIEIVINRNTLEGSVNLVSADGQDLSRLDAEYLLSQRTPHPGLHSHPKLPDDSRLWAALQQASGGIWSGCVYDVDRIVAVIEAGLVTFAQSDPPQKVLKSPE
jgi:dihydroxyacid dehydratase/phosphogluconate dehydratase